MQELKDPQDATIRMILIGAGVSAVLGFIAFATAISIMISLNFNILNWME